MALALRGRSLLTKLYLAMAAVVLPLLLLHLLYVLPAVEASLHEERVRALRQLVETAHGVLERYEARVRAGELTVEQAQAEAARLLEQLRHGAGEHFWVNDLSTRLVVHPHLPSLLGQDMTEYRDASGKALFVDIVALAREQREGALSHLAVRPGEARPGLKHSYVKLFVPWGWVMGTSVSAEDVDREASALKGRLALAGLAALVLAGLVGLVLARALVRPVRVLADAAERVAQGNLEAAPPVDGQDEVGRVGRALHTLVGSVQETVRGLTDVALSTVAEADRIRATTDTLCLATREQSERLQQLAQEVQQLSWATSQSAQGARGAVDVASTTVDAVEQGGAAVESTSRQISELVQVVLGSEQRVSRLHDSGTAVAQMLRLIQDVSNETNILAVNTAIESARAGEHGKGFGVVAEEVRKLASRTRQAVQQIEHLLAQNQEDTSAAVALMQQGTEMVEEGMRLSAATGEVLARILGGTRQIHDGLKTLAEAGKENSDVGARTAELLHSLSTRSEESVRGVENIVQAAGDLHRQAQALWALAARFSLPAQPAPTGGKAE